MKGSSELSVLMAGGGSCNGENSEIQPPKFENFLSVGNGGDYMYSTMQLPPQAAVTEVTTTTHDTTRGSNNMNNNSSIGLSMIKNWLRNNPTPSNQNTTTTRSPLNQENDSGTGTAVTGGFTGCGRSNELSLSMSTGDTGGFVVSGGGDSSSSDNKRQQMEVATTIGSESGGVTTEAVPRKSIDTFGQRTSIYRGVTRSHSFIIQLILILIYHFLIFL